MIATRRLRSLLTGDLGGCDCTNAWQCIIWPHPVAGQQPISPQHIASCSLTPETDYVSIPLVKEEDPTPEVIKDKRRRRRPKSGILSVGACDVAEQSEVSQVVAGASPDVTTFLTELSVICAMAIVDIDAGCLQRTPMPSWILWVFPEITESSNILGNSDNASRHEIAPRLTRASCIEAVNRGPLQWRSVLEKVASLLFILVYYFS